MSVDWNAEILGQVETHWAERLRPRLEGLTDSEFFWQPVRGCWTISRRGLSDAPVSYGSGDFTWDYGPPAEGPEPVTTIAWRLGHIIETLASTNGVYFGGPEVRVETFDYPGSADAALEALDDTYGAWIAGVRSLGTEGLVEPQGSRSPAAFADAPVARVILYTSVEIFHHGAEICLLRDLHARTAMTQ